MADPLVVEDELGNPLTLTPESFTIAAQTMRTAGATPSYDAAPLDLLTVADTIAVHSAHTSGAVVPVLIVQDGVLYLGIGSDHRASDANAAASGPKPLGPRVVRIDDETLRSGRLDVLAIESAYDGAVYQRGSLHDLLPLAAIYDRTIGRDDAGRNGIVFCGTIARITAAAIFGYTFTASIRGPGIVEDLALAYDVESDETAESFLDVCRE